MLLHNLHIAWKSMKRNRTLSALIVTGIALGIALSTTFAAARHAFARDPIPGKSRVLHYVRLDSWDPQKEYPARERSGRSDADHVSRHGRDHEVEDSGPAVGDVQVGALRLSRSEGRTSRSRR